MLPDFMFKFFQFYAKVLVRKKHFTKFDENSDDPDNDLNSPIAI